jgi:hypothetical protein
VLTKICLHVGRGTQAGHSKVTDFQHPFLKLRGCVKVGNAQIAPGFSLIAPGFSLNEARIGTVVGGESGLLVWKFDQLVAVLTRIDEEAYSTKGKWFLETGFGLLSGRHKNFDTIEEALIWVGRHTFPSSLD